MTFDQVPQAIETILAELRALRAEVRAGPAQGAASTTGEELLTVSDVAKRLRYSTKQVRTWAKDGALPALRHHGGRWRFKLADVESFGARLSASPDDPTTYAEKASATLIRIRGG